MLHSWVRWCLLYWEANALGVFLNSCNLCSVMETSRGCLGSLGYMKSLSETALNNYVFFGSVFQTGSLPICWLEDWHFTVLSLTFSLTPVVTVLAQSTKLFLERLAISFRARTSFWTNYTLVLKLFCSHSSYIHIFDFYNLCDTSSILYCHQLLS